MLLHDSDDINIADFIFDFLGSASIRTVSQPRTPSAGFACKRYRFWQTRRCRDVSVRAAP